MEEEGSHVSVTLGRAFETVQDLVLSIRKNPDVFTLAPYRETLENVRGLAANDRSTFAKLRAENATLREQTREAVSLLEDRLGAQRRLEAEGRRKDGDIGELRSQIEGKDKAISLLQEVAKQSKDELISKDKRYRALTEVAKRLRGELEESRPKLEMVPVLQDANARLKEDLDNVTAAYLKLLAERKNDGDAAANKTMPDLSQHILERYSTLTTALSNDPTSQVSQTARREFGSIEEMARVAPPPVPAVAENCIRLLFALLGGKAAVPEIHEENKKPISAVDQDSDETKNDDMQQKHEPEGKTQERKPEKEQRADEGKAATEPERKAETAKKVDESGKKGGTKAVKKAPQQKQPHQAGSSAATMGHVKKDDQHHSTAVAPKKETAAAEDEKETHQSSLPAPSPPKKESHSPAQSIEAAREHSPSMSQVMVAPLPIKEESKADATTSDPPVMKPQQEPLSPPVISEESRKGASLNLAAICQPAVKVSSPEATPSAMESSSVPIPPIETLLTPPKDPEMPPHVASSEKELWKMLAQISSTGAFPSVEKEPMEPPNESHNGGVSADKSLRSDLLDKVSLFDRTRNSHYENYVPVLERRKGSAKPSSSFLLLGYQKAKELSPQLPFLTGRKKPGKNKESERDGASSSFRDNPSWISVKEYFHRSGTDSQANRSPSPEKITTPIVCYRNKS